MTQLLVQQGIIWLWHALLSVCRARHLCRHTKALCTAAELNASSKMQRGQSFCVYQLSIKLGCLTA